MIPHTRRPRRTTAMLGALALLAPVLLAGCSQAPPHAAGAIAVVIGDRANMPEPQLTTQDQTMLDQAFLSKDMLYVVSDSGNPQTVYQKQLTTACDSSAACTGAVDSFNASVLPGLVSDARAESTEADPLDAVLTAAQDVDSAGLSGPKQIIVIDSGLQTTGDLTFQSPGAFAVSPSAVTAQLEAKAGRLTPLKGVDVLWDGLGTVYTPQQQVPADDVSQLQSIWSAILQAGGAKTTFASAEDPATGPVSGLPSVTTVSFAVPPTPPSNCYRLREDQVGFEPGEAVFRDPATARQVLTPIAETLKKEQVDATVIGTAALPGSEWVTLSQERAAAAAKVLESMGVPSSMLTEEGVGVHFAGFVPDTDASGQLIETEAVQNRLVIIEPDGTACT